LVQVTEEKHIRYEKIPVATNGAWSPEFFLRTIRF